MKRVISIMLAITMMIIAGVSTSAALPEEASPFYIHIKRVNNVISFDGTNGEASASVQALSGTTKITGTLTVYKQSGNNWISVGSSSNTVTSSAMVLSVNFTGYSEANYKAVFSFSVTRNGTTESESNTTYEICPKA